MAKKKKHSKQSSVSKTASKPVPEAEEKKSAPPSPSLNYLAKVFVFPCVLGWLLLYSETGQEYVNKLASMLDPTFENTALSNRQLLQDSSTCLEKLRMALGEDSFSGVSIALHRNGQVEPCGMTMDDVLAGFETALASMDECPGKLHKYFTESLMTAMLHQMVSSCPSEESNRRAGEGFLGYCDMGEDRTPILLDHDKLEPITSATNQTYLPCHFHTREGVRVTNLRQLAVLARRSQSDRCDASVADEYNPACVKNQVHLYAVPAGRVYMFAPSHVGEKFSLPHVRGADPNLPVYLRVLSTNPRVFDLFNFFTRDESRQLVEKARDEKSETHRIKRSSTGASGYNINMHRTSESGFDTHGKIAVEVKRRCFKVLGFDEYLEGHGDGLQILRYNLTTAYTPHMDYFDDPRHVQEHDFDSARKGGNRFATILLYMTDLGEHDGGETVFMHGVPEDTPEEERLDYKTALRQLRESNEGMVLEEGSWEEDMVAKCRSSLSVRPNSARAVLFYSQHPNGEEDKASLHGGCPVLAGEKWAANLWVWNTPRGGFPGAPVNEKFQRSKPDTSEVPTLQYPKKQATFHNYGTNPAFQNAELYFEDNFWAKLGHGDPASHVDTYEGQVWNVKVDGEIMQTWVIGKNPTQAFSV